MTSDLTTHSKPRLLAQIPQESVWLANFISKLHTKKTYSLSVREFIAFNDIKKTYDLQYIDQAHVIAWRDFLISQGASAKTINTKISAISSLFKHLCEKQITKRNKIAIHQELKIALQKYLFASGHVSENNSPLILALQRAKLRRHLTKNQLANIFNEYTKKAGLPKGVYPHSARATFITHALENGAKIEAVQRSVGHSKINTTQMYDKRLVKHRESASFAVRWQS
jgi:site-specific recombinase XerD